jgi:hypothetical protein
MDENKKINVESTLKRHTVTTLASDKVVSIETSKTIRKVMEVLEGYTNFLDLEVEKKAIVRDTVLNQINKLSRVVKHKQTIRFD